MNHNQATPYSLNVGSSDITHFDIYKTLTHHGYNIVSHIPGTSGEVKPIEPVMVEVLSKAENSIEMGSIPYLLSTSNVFLPKLSFLVQANPALSSKAGYFADKASELFDVSPKDKLFLDYFSSTLEFSKSDNELPLLEGLPSGMIEAPKATSLEEKWGVIDTIDYGIMYEILNYINT